MAKKQFLKNGGKKNLHLLVNPKSFERFRENCSRAQLDLSRATELLWDLWGEGKISISIEVQVLPAAQKNA